MGSSESEELAQCENGWALILENTEGLPLRKLMDAARLDLPDSLKVAVSLTGTLKEVHRQGLLHKMINPFNIFVDPASGNGQTDRLRPGHPASPGKFDDVESPADWGNPALYLPRADRPDEPPARLSQ